MLPPSLPPFTLLPLPLPPPFPPFSLPLVMLMFTTLNLPAVSVGTIFLVVLLVVLLLLLRMLMVLPPPPLLPLPVICIRL